MAGAAQASAQAVANRNRRDFIERTSLGGAHGPALQQLDERRTPLPAGVPDRPAGGSFPPYRSDPGNGVLAAPAALPRLGSGRLSVRSVVVFGQEVQHFLPVLVELGMIEQCLAVARARQVDLEDLADRGIRPVGH